MSKSLLNGLAGIRAHQTQMDVIGNNIANLNTVGYKTARATFQETLNQTIASAQPPVGGMGGVNPSQIGLGTAIGAIKSTFTQGNLQETGSTTDLAILGNGFFVVHDGEKNFFTRNGSFHFDANGTVVNNQGLSVQGKQADARGKLSNEVGAITIPADKKIPAQATTGVTFSGNLNSEEQVLGTITKTKPFMATVNPTEDFNGLYANGTAETFLQLTRGMDTLTVGYEVTGTGETAESTFTYGIDFTSIDDLVLKISDPTTGFNGAFNATNGTNGQIQFTSVQAGVRLKMISDTSSALNQSFGNVNGRVLINVAETVDSDEFAHVAKDTDAMVQLRNAQGDRLDLVAGDRLDLKSVTIGGNELYATSESILKDAAGGDLLIDDTTTLQQLRTGLQEALFQRERKDENGVPFSASERDPVTGLFTAEPEEMVSIGADGTIRINGGLGIARGVEKIQIGAIDPATGSEKAKFGGSVSFFDSQKAEDVTHIMSTTVFDNMGQAHDLNLEFKKTREAGKWSWSVALTGNEKIKSGGSGTIRFNADGSLQAFEYLAGATALSFDPGNNADFVEIEIGVGLEQSFNGITHFAASSTTTSVEPDGYPPGSIETIDVDDKGLVSANFDNGERRPMAQLVLAQFNNPAGLLKVQDSMFTESVNSGGAIVGDPGITVQAKLISKKLEQSNVDIAEEFARLIMAQRGLQANSRVITTSDDIMNELINLKR